MPGLVSQPGRFFHQKRNYLEAYRCAEGDPSIGQALEAQQRTIVDAVLRQSNFRFQSAACATDQKDAFVSK